MTEEELQNIEVLCKPISRMANDRCRLVDMDAYADHLEKLSLFAERAAQVIPELIAEVRRVRDGGCTHSQLAESNNPNNPGKFCVRCLRSQDEFGW